MWLILEWILLVLILSPFEILVALWIGKWIQKRKNKKEQRGNDS